MDFQELKPIKMYHVFGTISYPNLCFPSNFRHPFPKLLLIKEASHKNRNGSAFFHLLFQFPYSDFAHRPSTMNSFYQKQQIFFAAICNNIR